MAGLTLAACTQPPPNISAPFNLDDDGGYLTGAKSRVIIAQEPSLASRPGAIFPNRVTCVEPHPDVASSLVNSFGVGASLFAKGSASLSGSQAEGLAQIAQRTVSIQTLQRLMFRACEAYTNGAMTGTSYSLLLSEINKTMVTLVLAETAGGRFGASGAAIGGEASSDVTAELDELETLLINLEQQSDEVDEAKEDLEDANDTNDQVVAQAAADGTVDGDESQDIADSEADQEKAAENLASRSEELSRTSKAIANTTAKITTVSGLGAIASKPSDKVAATIEKMQANFLSSGDTQNYIAACLVELGLGSEKLDPKQLNQLTDASQNLELQDLKIAAYRDSLNVLNEQVRHNTGKIQELDERKQKVLTESQKDIDAIEKKIDSKESEIKNTMGDINKLLEAIPDSSGDGKSQAEQQSDADNDEADKLLENQQKLEKNQNDVSSLKKKQAEIRTDTRRQLSELDQEQQNAEDALAELSEDYKEIGQKLHAERSATNTLTVQNAAAAGLAKTMKDSLFQTQNQKELLYRIYHLHRRTGLFEHCSRHLAPYLADVSSYRTAALDKKTEVDLKMIEAAATVAVSQKEEKAARFAFCHFLPDNSLRDECIANLAKLDAPKPAVPQPSVKPPEAEPEEDIGKLYLSILSEMGALKSLSAALAALQARAAADADGKVVLIKSRDIDPAKLDKTAKAEYDKLVKAGALLETRRGEVIAAAEKAAASASAREAGRAGLQTDYQEYLAATVALKTADADTKEILEQKIVELTAKIRGYAFQTSKTSKQVSEASKGITAFLEAVKTHNAAVAAFKVPEATG
ncbi:MAG: hypothetical protein RIM72_22690 [Alphaproteobacteria bacterium]